MSESDYRTDFSLLPNSKWPPSALFAAILSLLLHLVFGYLIVSVKERPPNAEIFQVSIVSFQENPPAKINNKVERQIVSPSNQAENVPLETTKESDISTKAEKEQLKRGEFPQSGPTLGGKNISPANGAKEASKSAASPEKAANEVNKNAKESNTTLEKAPQFLKSNSKRSILTLDSETLKNEFSVPRESSNTANLEAKANQKPETPSRPFSRPPGAPAKFLGTIGSADYLPNLPDGDLTLLNAKANRFAVFVRRVALQVFTQLRFGALQTLPSAQVNAVQNEVAIRAILSPAGSLLRADIVQSSGSQRFDEIVLAAVKSGATDPNPPKAAARADDGTISFIFQSRSWSRIVPTAGGFARDQRWILLATGLE